MESITIKLNESEDYIQRTAVENPSDDPLTIQEQVILKLYDELREANEEIILFHEEIDWYHQQEAKED